MRNPVLRMVRALGLMPALCAALLISACSLKPETAPMDLGVKPDATIWPAPPEIPRYAYVNTLIGERNFFKDKEAANKTKSVVAWLVGLVVGEREFIELRRPVSGLVDDLGRVMVVDASHQGIVVFDMEKQQVDIWKEGAEGENFISPVAIAVDGLGGFYVSDSERGKVYHLGPFGEPLTPLGDQVLQRPTGVARNPYDGSVFVSDTGSHDIKVFDPDGHFIDTIGERGTDLGDFNTPTHLAFNGKHLYVADTLNFRVQSFDTLGDQQRSFGQLGLNVGNMSRPKGVAIGGDGRIYVVESYYDHLLVFDANGQLLLPIGGTGQGQGQFYLPSGVWTDKDGRVYVADMFNGRVAIFKELTGSGTSVPVIDVEKQKL